MIGYERLTEILAGYAGLKIGLLGDLFLDRYLMIDPALHEISVETDLEAYQVAQVRNQPGALGTVMNNLTALGVGTLVPVTVVGEDGEAFDVLKELDRLGVETQAVVRDGNRQTPTYTKPMKQDESGVWQELNRLDLRPREPLAAETEKQALARMEEVFHATDGLIVLDQVPEEGWGVVTPAVRDRLVELSEALPDKLIFVDSRSHIGRFRSGILKPNLHECLKAVGQEPSDDPRKGREAALELSRRNKQQLYCTMGADGILIVDPSGDTTHVPAYPVSGPIDIVGAGDSTTSGIVASLLSSAAATEAAAVGNLVASITVQQLGTTGTATPDQVRDRWQQTHGREEG